MLGGIAEGKQQIEEIEGVWLKLEYPYFSTVLSIMLIYESSNRVSAILL